MKKIKLIKNTIIVVMAGALLMLSACESPQESESLLFLMEKENLSGTETEALHYLNAESEPTDEKTSDSTQKTVVVHICGEVLVPGVYEVPAGKRIYDVVQMAGGFTSEASEEYLNLALPVSDGMQIVILSEEEAEKERQRKETSGLININTATVEQLCTLPGIGNTRATDIVAYRNKNGDFASTEDIMKVSGIKNAMYEKLKDKICVK